MLENITVETENAEHNISEVENKEYSAHGGCHSSFRVRVGKIEIQHSRRIAIISYKYGYFG